MDREKSMNELGQTGVFTTDHFRIIAGRLACLMRADLMSPYDTVSRDQIKDGLITEPDQLIARTGVERTAQMKGLVFTPENGPPVWYIRSDIREQTVLAWQGHRGKLAELAQAEHNLLGVTIEEISHVMYRSRHETLYGRPPGDVMVELVGALDRYLTLETMQTRTFNWHFDTTTDEFLVEREMTKTLTLSMKERIKLLTDNVFCSPIESRSNLKPHIAGHRLAVGIVKHFEKKGGGLRKFALSLRTVSDDVAIREIFNLGIKIPYYNNDERMYLLMQLAIMGFSSAKYLKDETHERIPLFLRPNKNGGSSVKTRRKG